MKGPKSDDENENTVLRTEEVSRIKKKSWFGDREVQLLACCFEVPAMHLEGSV